MSDMDARILLAGLEAYHESLTRHNTSLGEEFEQVSRAWLALDECFAGNAADEFRPIWETTSSRFRDYTERTSHILGLLEERIEKIRRYESTSGLNG